MPLRPTFQESARAILKRCQKHPPREEASDQQVCDCLGGRECACPFCRRQTSGLTGRQAQTGPQATRSGEQATTTTIQHRSAQAAGPPTRQCRKPRMALRPERAVLRPGEYHRVTPAIPPYAAPHHPSRVLRHPPNHRTPRLRALNPALTYSNPSRQTVRTDTPHHQEIREPPRPPLHRVQGFSAIRKLSSGHGGLRSPARPSASGPSGPLGGAATSFPASSSRPHKQNGLPATD